MLDLFGAELFESPVALFQGIKRPYLAEGLDSFVYVYASNTAITSYYSIHDRWKNTGPHVDAPPDNSVFTIFVSLARDMIERMLVNENSPGTDVRGVILAWEWTAAAVEDCRLPEAHQTRYKMHLRPPS